MKLERSSTLDIQFGPSDVELKTLLDVSELKIAFLHIPKTAGFSIVDAFVHRLGADRCLAFSPTIRAEDFYSRTFVSGHVWLQDITPSAYRFTFLRDPVEQIASHLLWIDHYNMPEYQAETAGFSASVRADIGRLKNVDLSSAREIADFLRTRPRDADIKIANVQCEMLALSRGHVSLLDNADLARRAVAALARVDFVGMTEHLRADLVELFRLLGLQGKPEVKHLNASPSARRIDLAVPAIRRALEAHVGADLRLWEAASALRERRIRLG